MGARPSNDYIPPAAGDAARRQNDLDALRLLIAQRRLYRRAKRWLGLRWFGMVVIGLGAPVASVLHPGAAVVAGAVAGLWLFLGRTLLVYLQSGTTAKAAAIQEQFDFYVYDMPASIDRSTLPSLEQISVVAGPDDELRKLAEAEKLVDWYVIDANDSPAVAVAICQRANVSYANSLLRTTAVVWSVVTGVWVVGLVIAASVAGLSALQFLAGIVLPILPAFLDIVQYVIGIVRAARDRADLATTIEERLRGIGDPVDPSDLQVWQERLYGLRRSTPEVPDLIYKLQRKRNERAMKSAARQLSRGAKGSGQ